MFSELYYIPFYLESVLSYSPTITGVSLIPLTAALLPTSVLVGRLMTRTGRYRWAIWLGWALSLLGTGLLIMLDATTKPYAWVLIFVVVGLGHGMVLMSLNFSVQASAETRNVAYAAAMYTFTRTFGMCIGVAIGGAVFQNQMKRKLGEVGLPQGVAANAEEFVGELKGLPRLGKESEYEEYVGAYVGGFRGVWEVLTAIAGFAGLLSLLIKELTMDKELDSEHILLKHKKDDEGPEMGGVGGDERRRSTIVAGG